LKPFNHAQRAVPILFVFVGKHYVWYWFWKMDVVFMGK